MKATLDEKGTLVIETESPLEGFAMSHWYAMWRKKEASFLVRGVARNEDGNLDTLLNVVKP